MSARSFLSIWFGQAVSTFGSSLTAFVVSAWLYERSRSATLVALVWIATTLPDLLLSPFAGVLVDRWNRRWAMIVSDLGSAAGTLTMALLALIDRLQVWQILAATAWISIFGTLLWPAYSAAMAQLLPRQQLGRANGLVQVGDSAARLAAPILAGVLLVRIHLAGVLLIDFATFAASLLALSLARVPPPPHGGAPRRPVLDEVATGWRYIQHRRGLLALLVYFAGVNIAAGFAQVLITPLVLSFATPAVLGTVMSIGGIGLLAGSLLLGAWGGGRSPIRSVLAFTGLMGISVLACGLAPWPLLIGLGVAGSYFATPLVEGASQVLWQSKTSPEVLGRVFALRKVTALCSRPVAYVFAGVLDDRVFEPAMAPGGALVGTAGRLLGVGTGRGAAALFCLSGLVMVGVALAGCLYGPLRRIDRELPDVTEVSPVAAAES